MSRSGSHSTTGSRQASIASAVGPATGAAGASPGPSRGPSLEEVGSRQFSFRTLLPEGPRDGWTEAGPERSTAERMGSSPLRVPVLGEQPALASAGSKAAGQGGGEYVSPFEAASQVGACRVVHRVRPSRRHLRQTGSWTQYQPVLAVSMLGAGHWGSVAGST